MAQHEERPYGERHDAHGDHHAHEHAHGHDTHGHVPYDLAQVEHEITADRQWMFHKFNQLSFWVVLHIFVILALLALTQT